ncbi:hypothetical protein G3N95_00330 [Paraburkholderia sp. Tr-20389]|uniref:glycine zipper family protein n=1 Tax=Paraburkholderia sp. Tr-20389 TaxID=2703903 RepID=UPI002402C291|nr:glycine zipper family protein [Paraburkholderia sp. Tr-20389]MBN3751368.1 hypothetical protein [Paraburkholderia sp. Tr-20389]
MLSKRRMSVIGVVALLCCQTVAEAQPVAYPAKGQSPEKQQQDQGACASWAKQQTGVDPAAVAATPPPPSGPAVGGGERVGGAARGAAGGAVIGAIAGDAGKGAAIGAAAGTMGGGMRARQNQRNAQANSQAQQQNAMGAFNQAYSACMSGRGYTMH